MTAIILILLAIVPLDLPATDHVQTLEINHVYSEEGKPVLTQAIVWQWNRATSRDEVRCWWLIREGDEPAKDWLRWDGGTMRRIVADRVVVVHSGWDRELEDRQRLPVEDRRNLSPDWKQVRRVLEE